MQSENKTKTCRTCGTTKDLDLFHNRKDAKDGKFNDCKVCVKERNKEWRKTPAGKSLQRRKGKQFYDKHKWNENWVEKRREKDREWYAQNREKKLESVKKYQAKRKAKEALTTLIGEDFLKWHNILTASLKIHSILMTSQDDIINKELSDLVKSIEAFKDEE